MNKDDLREQVVEYWICKAEESLSSARSEQASERFLFAVNRAYYACFYAASAVLLKEGIKFTKHTGVRAAVHKHLIKTGRIDPMWGRVYNRAFENRQRGDYLELVEFDHDQVRELVEQSSGFVLQMKQLLNA